MKARRSASQRSLSTLLTVAGLMLAAWPCHTVLAQDRDFLACDRHTDRGQRIACLEDALEAARTESAPAESAPAESALPPPAVSPAPVAATPLAETVQPVASPPAAPAAAPAAEDGNLSLSDQPHNFGLRETARVSADTQSRDQLQDTIARLEKRNDLWIVTLSGGQVWRQQFPRTLNLREGDEITIYQAGFGEGYRLSAKRLSGFVRVERVR